MTDEQPEQATAVGEQETRPAVTPIGRVADAVWHGAMETARHLIAAQPGARVFGPPGAGGWASPHGVAVLPAERDGPTTTVVCQVGLPGGGVRNFRISVRVDVERDG